MLQLRYIFFINGITLAAFSATMLIPLLVEYLFYDPIDHFGFGFCAFIGGSLGGLMCIATRPKEKIILKVRDTFFLTTTAWVIICIAGAGPIYLSSYNLSFIDALFESVSGLTTTGATVLSGLDFAPRSLILWRAILQWLGGTGIILMALSVLPMLRIGGMQLFHAEFSDRSEKILPRVSQIAAGILVVYTGFTVICLVAFYMAGMTFFDAICLAMCTISTGGLVAYDQSFQAFSSPLVEWIAIIGMLIGSSTLVLFVKALHRPGKMFFNTSQMRVFFGIVVFSILCLTVWNYVYFYSNIAQALRYSAFTVVSMITTTGFVGANYDHWGSFALVFLYLISLIGGCTGSTAGGLKVFRLQILWQMTLTHLKQLIRPHGVYLPTFEGKKIEAPVITSIFSFVTLFFMTLLLLTVAISLCGNDAITSLCAATATLNNGAASFGNVIGATGTYEAFNEATKLILSLSMILGRLELLTVVVLLIPAFWKR